MQISEQTISKIKDLGRHYQPKLAEPFSVDCSLTDENVFNLMHQLLEVVEDHKSCHVHLKMDTLEKEKKRLDMELRKTQQEINRTQPLIEKFAQELQLRENQLQIKIQESSKLEQSLAEVQKNNEEFRESVIKFLDESEFDQKSQQELDNYYDYIQEEITRKAKQDSAILDKKYEDSFIIIFSAEQMLLDQNVIQNLNNDIIQKEKSYNQAIIEFKEVLGNEEITNQKLLENELDKESLKNKIEKIFFKINQILKASKELIEAISKLENNSQSYKKLKTQLDQNRTILEQLKEKLQIIFNRYLQCENEKIEIQEKLQQLEIQVREKKQKKKIIVEKKNQEIQQFRAMIQSSQFRNLHSLNIDYQKNEINKQIKQWLFQLNQKIIQYIIKQETKLLDSLDPNLQQKMKLKNEIEDLQIFSTLRDLSELQQQIVKIKECVLLINKNIDYKELLDLVLDQLNNVGNNN